MPFVTLPLGRRTSSDPIASDSAPASELAVQLPASASNQAVPPPAASTAEAVDLSAGAAILKDSGPTATRTWVQTLLCTMYCFIVVPCRSYEYVACLVLSNGMDVNMNTIIIILRLHPTRGLPNNACLVANA